MASRYLRSARRISTTVTDIAGYYNFTNLVPGGYVVVITTTNFGPGGVLAGYRNSTPTDPGNGDVDNRDHGNEYNPLTPGYYVASTVVTLTPGAGAGE